MSKDKRDERMTNDHPRDSKRTQHAKRETINRKRERAHKQRIRAGK